MLIYTFSNSIKKMLEKKYLIRLKKKIAIKFCKVRLLKSRLIYTRHDYVIAFSFLFCPQTTCIKLKLILMGIFLPFVLACCKLESATKKEREEKKGDDLYCLVDLLKQPIKP